MSDAGDEAAREKYQRALDTLRAVLSDPKSTNQDLLLAASRLREAGGDTPPVSPAAGS